MAWCEDRLAGYERERAELRGCPRAPNRTDHLDSLADVIDQTRGLLDDARRDLAAADAEARAGWTPPAPVETARLTEAITHQSFTVAARRGDDTTYWWARAKHSRRQRRRLQVVALVRRGGRSGRPRSRARRTTAGTRAGPAGDPADPEPAAGHPQRRWPDDTGDRS